MDTLLKIRGLKLDLMSTRGIVYALSGVDMDIARGEIHGLVGESGSGKSMTSRSIMRLHDKKKSRISGEILYNGTDLLKLPESEMQKLRGNRISMIFQDPMTSLNPLMTVGAQISEVLLNHERLTSAEVKERTISLLEKVGITSPESRIDQYPFELSGGMQQRIMIAIAIACNPDLLIADEPTTALDVTIQAQILSLLKKLQKEMGMSILLITHNFGVVAEVCDRVSVMYAGKVVETAGTRTIFRSAAHAYSRALINSIPKVNTGSEYLPTIEGSPPQLFSEITNCSFAPRCPLADSICESVPELVECGDEEGHVALCHHIISEDWVTKDGERELYDEQR